MVDMELAEEVLGAMREDRVLLRREPVCSVANPSHVLYHECLATVVDGRGEHLRPSQFIPPLEQLQLMRAFDRYVVRRVVAMLREEPRVRLGVNVSAQSAVPDVVWQAQFAELEHAPEVALRLVVEITETARLERHQGRRFCNRLQQVGCSVAVDDFGAGYGVETAIEIRSPDIIKIDASVLGAMRRGECAAARLVRMVQLAGDLAGEVVVEGVEAPEDLERVHAAGAAWWQGRLVTPGAVPSGADSNGNTDRTKQKH